jgi:hypothetical protein
MALAVAFLADFSLRAPDVASPAVVAIVVDHHADAIARLEFAWVIVAQARALPAVGRLGASIAARPAVAVVGQDVHTAAVAVDERWRADASAGVTTLSGVTECAARATVFRVVRQAQAGAGAARCACLAFARAATEAADGWRSAAHPARAAVGWSGFGVDTGAGAVYLTSRASAFAGRALEGWRAGDAATATVSRVLAEIYAAAVASAGTCRAGIGAAARRSADLVWLAYRIARAAIGVIDARIDASGPAFDLPRGARAPAGVALLTDLANVVATAAVLGIALLVDASCGATRETLVAAGLASAARAHVGSLANHVAGAAMSRVDVDVDADSAALDLSAATPSGWARACACATAWW